MSTYQQLLSKNTSLAVIGLGYVGLPVALAFAKKIKVIGFDINEKRIKHLQKSVDPSGELDKKEFEDCDIYFSSDPFVLKKASFFIIAVPTPVDEHNYPDLRALKGASEIVGKNLKKGDIVVYESTVYPGCTEEECIPVLERESGLKFTKDFKVGYSPERINPGDKEHTLSRVIKIVSANNATTLNEVASVYELIVTAGVHRAPSIKVAEAAKVIENTQRDLNIALMNELSLIFKRLNINTNDVLQAAGTKWNFLKFYPGLVGGHCIGVDPYYLTHKASEVGYHSKVILAGRYVNDSMGFYIAKQTVLKLIENNKPLKKSRVLVMGATFKENVEDIRNSKVVDIIKTLNDYKLIVSVTDPHANASEFKEEYGISLTRRISGKYDAVIVAVSHNEYRSLTENYFLSILKKKGFVMDIKGIFSGKFRKAGYWVL
ncbi:MAG: UDP-N-acetyl-D-galactosamine dehydrogenase [Bacteroidetes bacterium RIFCSPLOWO2_02_FULL_36_8]|nr:MAG: UDP-N-acetyl-D-galactosamine dehydrogenase [Bacteroidetes bacterium RIFCSPLOWO2_02_FULL_36_8]OFY70261.1 MAG: UDP-N-acetyl-D-galactosamine dehydrogenase [Bacteroidetes bacterium RIFCSPLOWO2_12_FULL_37_12]